MRNAYSLALAALLFLTGCADTPFVMDRPPEIPEAYHYVGGPDGGNWVILKQKSRRDYIITTFTRESPTRGLFRLEGEEPLPEKLTVEDLNGWDGIFMHTSIPDAQGGGRRNVKLRRIRRLD